MKKITCFILSVFVLFAEVSLFAYDRDWEKHPAYITVDNAQKVVAVGDIHGAFDELANSLKALGVASLSPKEKFRFDWKGGKTVLVFTGDFNDRGEHTKQVYDAVMDLEKKAAAKGGQVISMLGNHEIMLLSGMIEHWAKTRKSAKKRKNYQNTLDSFTRDGLDFHEAISEKGKYGQWIRNLPLFAVVNNFMFVHGGVCDKPTTRMMLEAEFKDNIEKGDFSKGMFMRHSDVLWNREWWNDDILVSRNLKVLDVKGIIFGHTRGALGKKGIIEAKDNRLVSIDIGMTPAYGNSKGGGLEILRTKEGTYRFTAKYPDRPSEHLFTTPLYER